ncbi:MAG: PAS domain S-box protein [Thainema sp.]
MARILVVEDHRIIAWNIQESLETLGHEVIGCIATGADAVEFVQQEDVDLILMDVRLDGDADGIQTAMTIQQQVRVPIVYLTAHVEPQTIQRAIATHPYGYLLKPVHLPELHTTVEMALHRHQLEQQLEATQQWLATTLNSIGDGTIAVDDVGRIIFMNPAAEALTGWTQQAAIGRSVESVLQLVSATTGQPIENPLRQCLTQRKQVFLADDCLLIAKDGTRRYIGDSATPIQTPDQVIVGSVLVFQDITARKQAEQALRDSEEQLRQIVNGIEDAFFLKDANSGKLIYINPASEKLFQYSFQELYDHPQLWLDRVHADDRDLVLQQTQAQQQGQFADMEYRIVRPDGSVRWIWDRAFPIYNKAGAMYRYAGVNRDITEQKQALEALRASETQFRQQVEQEQLLSRISQHIRQSLELEEILDTTVADIRQILNVDRVVIFQFDLDWSGTVIAEAVTAPWMVMKGLEIVDPCLSMEDCIIPYQQGRISNIANIHEAGLASCYVDLLNQFQVKANLVIPILESDQLWGLLAAQHCTATRHWQDWEIKLLQQLSNQLSIAIQQAELYQQVQQFNTTLEQQVYQRTLQLQQAAQFEETLKRITDKVRDSLDEAQILQTAVRELAIALSASACDAGLYDWEQKTSTVSYAHVCRDMPNLQGQVIDMSLFPQLYRQLQRGEYLHYCPTQSTRQLRAGTHQVSTLACPLQDAQSIVGDLWIHRQADAYFNEAEIRLVQQVANQCAIALRQARLYETSRTQIYELERLNLLKDDFLSTVSHELRTPMSSIQMATQMLEIVVSREPSFAAADHPIHRYLTILREECRRETNLINDLLDLSRLEAETEPLQSTTMNLQHWIPHVLESFVNQTRIRNQQFTLDIAADLPPLTTDFSYLERIVEELVENACKYTPAGEEIRLTVTPGTDQLQIRVSNTGVEIPVIERDRIFDKFYRIPNHDPWKHGGTGLGLALIKRMVHYLGGTIQLESMANPVTFRVTLPLTLAVG